MTPKTKKSPQPSAPVNPLLGWARQGVESFVAAQRILVDLVGVHIVLAGRGSVAIGRSVRERIGRVHPVFNAALEVMSTVGAGCSDVRYQSMLQWSGYSLC